MNIMIQPESTPLIRPVEQAGRLLGSLVAAGQAGARRRERWAAVGGRAAAVQVWVKAGQHLAGADADVEAFIRAYQDASRSYLLT
jgi:hypothetical protein